MLLMCARYERALMTQEIVRSEDAQCNTEESLAAIFYNICTGREGSKVDMSPQ